MLLTSFSVVYHVFLLPVEGAAQVLNLAQSLLAAHGGLHSLEGGLLPDDVLLGAALLDHILTVGEGADGPK